MRQDNINLYSIIAERIYVERYIQGHEGIKAAVLNIRSRTGE